MKLYKVTQTDNDDWDTYDSFICYANNEDEAKNLHPYKVITKKMERDDTIWYDSEGNSSKYGNTWAFNIKNVI